MKKILLAAALALSCAAHAQTLRYAMGVDATTLDPDAAIRDALALVAKEMPIVALHQTIVPWAMRRNVEARFAPNDIPYFFRFSVK